MANVTKNRPLSPHLQVYRFIPTMAMSIMHRITGAALYFGMILIAAWLVAAASGEESFNQANALFGSLVGQIILFGFTWALLHHLLGGLRHIMWDLGYGFEKEFSTKLAKANLAASIALTILVWIVVVMVR
ncbi:MULTISPECIES: succinate dehydrogenase, cytochrome b556 subunit [Pseudorhizobium]|jgi:succinate dehydrogenase, cytochrome b556 subunit|nr:MULTISPECIES: succinate dehydrogenase, cytochrome b556 subunit [Pseudorhizobium]CAD6598787.1 succinate dehydrogenase, cytochrome b556 subunit [Rhizobium sp. TCK]CAD6617448.1 succinate dehydrogenase, cytochrome b556 subunit [Pseudorhizobium flavum]CAD6619246.1 succinate dehydrogenase, cytochrome b556 subunit [arsenite-oxidising bacterium NT-25]CAD7023134.1 succinate dehydrogenase, cytochrome b556 subunit [Pseudorhizobium halotolerans]